MRDAPRATCTLESNQQACSCTYPGCSRKGRCCECLAYHRRNGELPGCLFRAEVKRTYNRSVSRSMRAYGATPGA
ncbi:MAG: hypothetical protein E4G93_05690 [Dehalococcoidia bacterium]|nr:MAG: hypothetical protein E4G93_05690 [Dehalococcoidia bacterium]